MFISRFWTLLLALGLGAAVAVLLLAEDLVNRERLESATAILYKDLDKVDIALNLHARKRIDVLVSVAVDPEVRKILATVSANPDKAPKHRQQLLTVLRQKNEGLGKYSADMLIALDVRGQVVVQVGKKQRESGYSLAGFPAVDAALRGFIRDDVWKLDNDVFLIAARPVIDQGRYVGAVVHGMRISDNMATEISPSAQVAFFAGNVPIAVGTPKQKDVLRAQGSVVGKPLDEVLGSKHFREKGYSEIQRIETADGDFAAVYSLVRGEAAKNDVGYAIIAPIDFMESAAEFYEKAGKQDVDALPTAWLIAGVVVLVLLGWFWNYLENERPLGRLRKAVAALEESDPKDQLNIYRFRRRIRKIAASINRVLDYKVKAMIEAAGGKPKSIDSILGSKDKDPRLSSATFKFEEASPDEVPPPPPSGGAPKPRTGPQPVGPPAPPSAPAPPAAPGVSPAPARDLPGGGPPPPPPGAPQVQAEMSPEEEQEYFRKIYDEFVALKQELGEDVGQLAFERFVVTLKKNRDTLIARYGCKRVTFQVYEKNGKASLKATPFKG